MTNKKHAAELQAQAMMYPWRWGPGVTIAHCRCLREIESRQPVADALRAGAAALRGIKTKCERHKEKDDDE